MKRDFGKGLESLIPKKTNNKFKFDTGSERQTSSQKEAIFFIETEKILPNPYQPRKHFDQDGLRALSQSIREYGVLQPLLVSRKEDNGRVVYQLVAGERRLLASKMAGLSQVPVIIRESTEREKLEMSIIENALRIDLNPMEKAEAFQRLHSEFGLLQKDIARVCGTSREKVANTLRLLELPIEIKDALKKGKITEGHARAILGAKAPEKQKLVFVKTIKDGLSVRDAEELVQKIEFYKPLYKKSPIFISDEFRALEKDLKEVLGVSDLKIKIEVGRPKLTIPFNSKKEIESFLKFLNSNS